MVAYETSDGDALLAVEALCRHIVGEGGFDENTQPTRTEVNRFRDLAYYRIAMALANRGYHILQTNVDVLGFLENLEILEIVISVELANPTTGPGQPNTRFMEFERQRAMLYASIGVLSAMGAASSGEAGGEHAIATGVSIAEKDSVYIDYDFVAPRFRRGLLTQPGSNPNRGATTGGTLASDTEG